MMLQRGMGAYPGDSYYDAGRPGWLPFWIDTVTESERKYQADSILQATVNAAGMAAGTVAGSVVSYAAGSVANAVTAAIDKTTASLAPSGYVVLAGAALAAFLLLKGRR